MPLNSLAQEALTIGGLPDGNRVEAIVADTINFAPASGLAAPSVVLARKPASSSASVSGTSVTFDTPGLYRVTITVGSFGRMVEVIVFPAAILGQSMYGGGLGSVARIPHLRGLAMDTAVTQATMATSLEAAVPTVIGIRGAGLSVAWSTYGN
jgi:hypothetical protein